MSQAIPVVPGNLVNYVNPVELSFPSSLTKRQPNNKRCPVLSVRPQPDRPAVIVDRLAHDRQPQSNSVRPSCKKRLKDLVPIFESNPCASVADFNLHLRGNAGLSF